MFLDVFLFEAEGFGSVEDEHFHAYVRRNFRTGEFGDEDHESDRERDRPDGGLFAEDAEERMRGPELIQIEHFEKSGTVRRECEVAEAGKSNAGESEETAGEHAGSGALHGHTAPPNTHEEERKITGGGDGKSLADHEVDLELLDLGA